MFRPSQLQSLLHILRKPENAFWGEEDGRPQESRNLSLCNPPETEKVLGEETGLIRKLRFSTLGPGNVSAWKGGGYLSLKKGKKVSQIPRRGENG